VTKAFDLQKQMYKGRRTIQLTVHV